MSVEPDVGAPPGREPPAWPEDEPRTFNRELSWLDFNERVLALAEDGGLPLLERAKFMAIFASNLDEFFQVRVAGLKEQLMAGVASPSADGRSPRKQLSAIREKVLALVERATRAFTEEVLPGLEKASLRLASWDDLDDEARAHLEAEFAEQIFLVLPDGERFVALETVIANHLKALFPGMEIVAHYPFRVTRDADIEIEEEEAADLLLAVESVLRRRRRSEDVVRLEVEASMPDEIRELLVRELKLEPEDVYAIDGTLDLGGLWALHDLDRPELKDDPWTPVTEPRLAGAAGEPPDLFGVLREGDAL